MTGGGDPEPRDYASSPCAMHEADPAYTGLAATPGDLKAWRKAQRERLIARRLDVPAGARNGWGDRIASALERAIGAVEGLTVSAYWPFRGEPDLRPFMERIRRRGARCALPVVVAKGAPLVFRAWRTGDPLVRGVWNIPIPPEDAPAVIPDVVISPVIGFDPRNYRLGYGGGFFDRTLASLPRRPLVFGVGYALASMPTIHPQSWDIAMDAIITEEGPAARRS